MLNEISQRKTNTIWFCLYVESEKQNKQNRNKLIDTENILIKAAGERGKGIKKCRSVVAEQSQGCKVQHREYSQ